MLLRLVIKNKEKRKHFAHLGAGLVILIHAYEKYEAGHSSYKLFALAAGVFIAVAWYHPVIEKKFPWVDGVFFLIEGLLSLIIAVDSFHAGKKALPFAYLLLGIFQFFVAFRRSRKGVEQHKIHLKS